MKPNSSKLSREDVLNALAAEKDQNRSVLERYLGEFPQFTIEITDLWREISRSESTPRHLSAEENLAIDETWKIYATSTSEATAKLLMALPVPKQRELAVQLEVPRQIIAAFRERKVIVSSIPRKFLRRLAEGLNASVEQVIAALSLPQLGSMRSHKSDEKPVEAEPATFEQLLIEAQVPEVKRLELMAK